MYTEVIGVFTLADGSTKQVHEDLVSEQLFNQLGAVSLTFIPANPELLCEMCGSYEAFADTPLCEQCLDIHEAQQSPI